MSSKNVKFQLAVGSTDGLSCAVMRGCKTCFEKRLRHVPVPHLMDIDGDLCHHIHIIKKFLNNFENCLEKLFQDLYRYFDLSADLLKWLELLCYHIDVTFCKPPNYIATPWLLVLDVCIDFLHMRDVYVFFYSSFDDNERSQIKKKLESIFEKYQRLLKNQLKSWLKHLVKKLSHQMAWHGK